MTNFVSTYREFVRQSAKSDRYWGFDLRALARLEPFLSFLYFDWWKVKFDGLDRLPEKGPAVIVGNQGSVLPWQALMLIYGLMSNAKNPRRVHIMCDLDWIDDERLNAFLVEIGFVPWSSASMKRLFAKGEIVAIFPEGVAGLSKPYSQRYRLQEFDWTRLLPAVEEGVRIFPLSALGCDEAVPLLHNAGRLAKFLKMPYFPVSPFFPWFPFPLNLASRPIPWKMNLMKEMKYEKCEDRDALEDETKSLSRRLEGEIQAQLNRDLRHRFKA
jgi:1-acyl-sn-glycerol-3-phosphate acyltransferase